MVRAWHGRGMARVNHTRPHFVKQIGKTHSKPLAARHGMVATWARIAVCELAFRVPRVAGIVLRFAGTYVTCPCSM
jgi:hypothetical protein